ncbi:YhdT family protein [Ornithinimicrobium cavernae]|uniref:YhdT family protein n=1 Tax=Ornithinimicrobium cavernae TaxID=2666047 RepID=UPI000D69ABC1|nr:YhdT family protein [Ornithinimicrobium cavernae]
MSSSDSQRSAPVNDFEEDPRYAASVREAWIAGAYWVVYTIVVTAVAWTLGYGKAAEEIRYVLGFPEWFLWSAGVATLVFCLIPYVLIRRYFVEVSLSPHGEDGDATTRTGDRTTLHDEAGDTA